MTSLFEDGFYVTAAGQAQKMVKLARRCDPGFVARLAVYSFESGKMKDVPVVLMATLMRPETMPLFDAVFPRVVTNGKQLCNFARVVRSRTVTSGRSFGTHTKRTIQKWLNARTPRALHKDSIGESPSLRDILRMVHPRPDSSERDTLYRYLVGREIPNPALLPDFIQAYEAFKAGQTTLIPEVDHRFLTALPLTTDQWKALGLAMPWHALRMNLNTLARHGCFDDPAYVGSIADRLVSLLDMGHVRVMPYQLLAAYKFADGLPVEVTNALQDAMEVAVSAGRPLGRKVLLMIDGSGSMSAPMSAQSKMTCCDVAGLFAAAIVRNNPDATVMVFNTDAHVARINPRDSVMTNAAMLAQSSGGTDCAAPMALANAMGLTADMLIMLSDNESWFNGRDYDVRRTGMASEWNTYRRRVPEARLVCVDIAVTDTTQVVGDTLTLNIGGFSDNVFDLINAYAASDDVATPMGLVERVMAVSFDGPVTAVL